MLYFKCPTCKTILANKELVFDEKLDKICKDTKLSNKQKDEQKMKLLDELELPRYCCRMRIMTSIKQIDIIK